MTPRHEQNQRGQQQGAAFCWRCLDRLSWKQPHNTPLGGKHGSAAALCEECWGGLTVEERVPYYGQLAALWGSTAADEDGVVAARVEALLTAVMDGR